MLVSTNRQWLPLAGIPEADNSTCCLYEEQLMDLFHFFATSSSIMPGMHDDIRGRWLAESHRPW
jgi:hypothetical protein